MDGDPSTSWFSAGNADPNGGSTLFTWRGSRDDLIGRVVVIGNERNANPAFRTGQGYLHTELQVLDANGAVVFDQAYSGPGGSTPDIVATPNVVGRTVVLKLSGRENPQCGGFSELEVFAAR